MDITKLFEDISSLNKLDCKTIPEKFIKFNEEFGEFSAEVVKLLGLTQKQFDKEHLIEEAADSLQVLISIMLAICEKTDITIEDIFDKIPEKNDKWRKCIPKYKITFK